LLEFTYLCIHVYIYQRNERRRRRLDKEILNMEEAAEFFGVSIKTFIKLLKEESVPARKIGREWRFSKKALVDWLIEGNSKDYSSSETETRDFFDKIAPEWENISGELHNDAIINRIANTDILKKNMTLVDLGAGDGYISRACAHLVRKVIAVDISPGMLKALESKAMDDNIQNIELIAGDGQDLPLEDCTVDIVCASMYLHHIEEPIIALKEMYRILKNGGRVYLVDFVRHKDKKLVDEMHDIWAGFKINEVEEWFKNEGFKNIHTEKLDDLKAFILKAEKERS
jgi:excisionase family DNA binding protein